MSSASSRRNANRARCRIHECGKFAQTRGLCKAHGGGSRCRDLKCHKLAQSRGLCIAHGGGRRCTFESCSKLAQSKGFCISHGGGRRCHVVGCDKFAQVRGLCKSHSKVQTSDSWSPVSSTSVQFTGISPIKSKLSIDFLVNPCNNKEKMLPCLHMTNFSMPHQRSLLSYLSPTTLVTTATTIQVHSTLGAHYPSALKMHR